MPVIESRRGISPSRSHGTVLETLASHGSSCLITKVKLSYGVMLTSFEKIAGIKQLDKSS